MIKIEQIVDKMHRCEDMWEIKMVEAVDNETIILIGDNDVPLDMQQIIHESNYRIYDDERYMIINGETFNHYDGMQFIKKQNEKREGYDWWRNDYYKEFLEENDVIIDILVIKLKPSADINKMYIEWKKKCEERKGFTVKKLIEELEKFDPNSIVYGVDYEYGPYCIKEINEKINRGCPDCNERHCTRCNNRKMFERKYIFLE